MSWQIAIDGPAASGKSTVAKELAKKLNFEYLDTGAMYRAVTLKALELGINLENEDEYQFLSSTSFDFINNEIILDGKNVSKEIRKIEVTNNASLVAKFPYVRTILVDIQRKIASEKNIIMDGRDIGTVVLPNANLKIYLTADVKTRAERRMKEHFETQGITQDLETTIKEIEARDYKDSHREVSPLAQAEDAVLIDTSNYNVKEVIEIITSLVLKRGYSMENLEQKNAKVEEIKKDDQQEAVAKEESKVEEVKPEEEVLDAANKAVVDDEASKEVATVEDATSEATTEEVVEESSEETVEQEKVYKEMQVVVGKVVEVQEAQEARVSNGKVIKKATEERVLIVLEDGQEGFLFRKDTAGIQDDEYLFDIFVEGDEVEVVIKKIFPDGGKFIFSTLLVEKRKQLLEFEKTVKERPVIVAKVIKPVADFGLLMKYEDFTCLLPTQLTTTPKEEFASLIGQELEVVPIRVDLSRIRIIVSQTHALQKKQRSARKEFLTSVEVGQVYEGVVKNIESYGAFIELADGVEGLLHISEVDHSRISRIEKVLNSGDTVKVQVIKVDKDHIGLSRKALLPNRWAEYFAEKNIGDVVTGKVIEINKAGIRVTLAEEIEGFVPKSEYSWEKDLVIEDTVKPDDEVTGKLIEIEKSKRRIIISVKQLANNPWDNVKVSEGDVIDVTVSKVQEEGYKVTYSGVTGYMSSKAVSRSREDSPLQEGEVVKVKVRIFDANKQRFILSMKDAEERVEKENFSKYMKNNDKPISTFGDFFNEKDKKSNKK